MQDVDTKIVNQVLYKSAKNRSSPNVTNKNQLNKLYLVQSINRIRTIMKRIR